MICPGCGVNLAGDLIYDTFFAKHGNEQQALREAQAYGATKTEGRWGREIALYDMVQDRTTAFRCPDCGHVWGRDGKR